MSVAPAFCYRVMHIFPPDQLKLRLIWKLVLRSVRKLHVSVFDDAGSLLPLDESKLQYRFRTSQRLVRRALDKRFFAVLLRFRSASRGVLEHRFHSMNISAETAYQLCCSVWLNTEVEKLKNLVNVHPFDVKDHYILPGILGHGCGLWVG